MEFCFWEELAFNRKQSADKIERQSVMDVFMLKMP